MTIAITVIAILFRRVCIGQVFRGLSVHEVYSSFDQR